MIRSSGGKAVDFGAPGAPALLHAGPSGDDVDWLAEHRHVVRAAVDEQGSLLVRGLGLTDVAASSAALRCVADELMIDREAFAGRKRYGDGVYSSSSWPANQQMCMHHELSHRLEFPRLMLFACLRAPTRGGAVGVADSAAVLKALPGGTVTRFEQEGWQLVRTYDGDVGPSIAEAFGTDDPAAVENYCRLNAIAYEWQPGGGLRTVQRRNAIVRHPFTGQRCWFNQIAFLNEWTLDREVREYLVEIYGVQRLPFTTRYGSGDPISEHEIRLINEVYESKTKRAQLQAGDLLLVDNIRMAHSRDPFEGERDVVVAMADAVSLVECLEPRLLLL